jgi:hypothetical protein
MDKGPWVARTWDGTRVIAEERFAEACEAQGALARWMAAGARATRVSVDYEPKGTSSASKQESVMDKGPWEVTLSLDCGGDWCVASDDFTHDVRIDFTGDFADDAERLAYCEWLAGVLNKASEDNETERKNELECAYPGCGCINYCPEIRERFGVKDSAPQTDENGRPMTYWGGKP